ncbi:MAG: alpha/beta hydrolase-fold protein [Thermoanaerobaculia bacterium]|nr:alpha/beta hydrolase-fold protein [Thermoanaerobaculia bacterium]
MNRRACVRWVLLGIVGCTVAAGAESWDARHATRTFESPAVGRVMAFDVVLPVGYEDSDRRYPVLYLLHGIRSHHGSWRSVLETLGSTSWAGDLIVVMPDAGNSWYVNWNSAGEYGAWEDYVVDDLIGHVDSTFRTVPERAGRALGGFSMGGFGALSIGLRNPERFLTVASISGYLDYARAARRELEDGEPIPRRRRQRPSQLAEGLKRFESAADPVIASVGFRSQAERTPNGRPFAETAQAAAHDPFALIPESTAAERPHIHLACGTEDPLYGFTRELAQLLLAERVPFGYWQSAGRHDDSWKAEALRLVIPRQLDEMQRALASRFSEENPT